MRATATATRPGAGPATPAGGGGGGDASPPPGAPRGAPPGPGAVGAAVDEVWRRREEGRLRTPAGVLVCPRRRPPDRMTDPGGLHAAGRRRPPLTPSEARALAAELAPAHDLRWLWRRFEGYRRRRGGELRDERRAFAGFARKCQRDRAGGAPWA